MYIFLSGGGVQSSGTLSGVATGQKLIVAGLLVQILFFGFFLIVVIIIQTKLNRHPTPKSLDPSINWRRHIIVMYIASLFIMIRSIMRVIEYLLGNAGYVLSHEVFLYTFDATLMFLVMLVYAIVHPSVIDFRRTEDAAANEAAVQTDGADSKEKRVKDSGRTTEAGTPEV
jgi:hypothetical protein